MKNAFEFTLEQLAAVIALSRGEPKVMEAFRALAPFANGSTNILAVNWLASRAVAPRTVCQAGVKAWQKLCRRTSCSELPDVPIEPFSLVVRRDLIPTMESPDRDWEPIVETCDDFGPPSLGGIWNRLSRSDDSDWSSTVVSPDDHTKDYFVFYRDPVEPIAFLAHWSGLTEQFSLYGEVTSDFLSFILS